MAKKSEIPNIEITPAGETPEDQQALLENVETSPGFALLAWMLVDLIKRESFTSVLDFSQQQVTLRYQIDAVWHSGQPMDRESGDQLLAALKKIAGMDWKERRARQEGEFGTLYKKVRQKFRIVSQGIKTGERVVIHVNWKRPIKETVEELGMRPRMIAQLAEILNNPETGMVLVTAVPGDGYTSAWRGVLSLCDRLTRDYYVIEEKNEVEPEVININSVEFDREAGQTTMSPIEQLLLKQPDVLAFNDLPDADTINSVVDLSVRQDMPMFVRSPGKSCLDSVLRLMALKPKVEPLLNRLETIVSMRVVRMLCERCRVAYPPHPQMLQKLGLPPGRISELYKPFVWQPGMVDENEKEIAPCPACHGIGYKGRTGLFESLLLNDNLRKSIMQTPHLGKLVAAAQAGGHITQQQEGFVLVARGVTSLEELQRVLKS